MPGYSVRYALEPGKCIGRHPPAIHWSRAQSPVLRRGRGRKCRLQVSLSHRYESVNCRIPLLGPRFAPTSCRASHAYLCLFLLDTDTGNCRKTCPTIMHPRATPIFTKRKGVKGPLCFQWPRHACGGLAKGFCWGTCNEGSSVIILPWRLHRRPRFRLHTRLQIREALMPTQSKFTRGLRLMIYILHYQGP